jgi:hypothetical protein
MKTKLIDFIKERDHFYSAQDLQIFSVEDLIAIKQRILEEAELKELSNHSDEEEEEMLMTDLSGGSIF